jgi:ribonuclease H / adenosylcobalamin/alpha-ribazole phosphatase
MNVGSGNGSSYRLQADGAARGNPGPAAFGYVIVAPSGEEVALEGEAIGSTTNNVAEYSGLIAGLEKAIALGVTRLDIRMDSELVVRQMAGRYRVKHPGLVPLFQRARGLVEKLESWSIAHVPREQNARADFAANLALDQALAARKDMESAR